MKYNKELLNRFLTEKVAIALRTQEEWDEFMELLEDETDAKWGTSEKPKQFNSWEMYREETSITYQYEGCRSLRYGSCAYLEELGCKIVEFKELIKERKMNLADKLRFLADRWEDGKEFYIGSVRYSLNKGKLIGGQSGFESKIKINELIGWNLKLAPQWTFTEDEKVILRNLPEKCKWIVRDKDGDVFVWEGKPFKNNYCGRWIGEDSFDHLIIFNHLFQSIQWSDEEPCPFREYL